MPVCPNCKKSVSEEMKFCHQCGQKLMRLTLKIRHRSASKLFNQASDLWRQRQRFLLNGDEEQARKTCVEVIRLCQLSIEADWRMGNAYVLLANALSLASFNNLKNLDRECYEFLLSRAAAIIHFWYLLPHRRYPTTKNMAIGKQLWREIFCEVREYNALTEDDALVLMDSYRDSLAADTISTSSFEQIEEVVSNQSPVMPSLITLPTAQSMSGSEVSKAEILEEIFQLERMFGIWLRRREGCLTWAEAHIIFRKIDPLRSHSFKAFPVMEEASEEEISEWLNDPRIDCWLPNEIAMATAAPTPIPVTTMERILRQLLQEDYDKYYRMAEAQLNSKR